MSNEKKKESNFVDLRELCIYRITIKCNIVNYANVRQGIEKNCAALIKEEIKTEV